MVPDADVDALKRIVPGIGEERIRQALRRAGNRRAALTELLAEPPPPRVLPARITLFVDSTVSRWEPVVRQAVRSVRQSEVIVRDSMAFAVSLEISTIACTPVIYIDPPSLDGIGPQSVVLGGDGSPATKAAAVFSGIVLMDLTDDALVAAVEHVLGINGVAAARSTPRNDGAVFEEMLMEIPGISVQFARAIAAAARTPRRLSSGLSGAITTASGRVVPKKVVAAAVDFYRNGDPRKAFDVRRDAGIGE